MSIVDILVGSSVTVLSDSDHRTIFSFHVPFLHLGTVQNVVTTLCDITWKYKKAAVKLNSESSSQATLIPVFTVWRGRSTLNRMGKKIRNFACSMDQEGNKITKNAVRAIRMLIRASTVYQT